MTIRKTQGGEITINLDGPDGNAFALMGYAKRYAKQLDLDDKAIIEEMMAGDYKHLVQTFDKHFGMIVVLETSQPGLLAEGSDKKFLVE